MTISRRAFLGITGGVVAGGAAAAVAGPLVWRDLVDQQVHRATSSTAPALRGSSSHSGNGRVLVVVNLGGGNDGLNTLVPAGVGAYHDARPSLGVADTSLVKLAGTTAYGLNPSLAPLQHWWETKSLVAVDGLAMPQQTRSHFLASDVWWTGQPNAPHGTGWLGRWLDADQDHQNPLRAISLGLPTLALTGKSSLATVLADPQQFALMTPAGIDAAGLSRAFLATSHPLSSDPTTAASQQAVPDALDAVKTLTPVLTGSKRVQFAAPVATPGSSTSSSTSSSLAPAPTPTGEVLSVTGLLEVAAGIVDLQIGTRVIMVSVSGFDTHANQAAKHPALLADLAQGLDGFLAAMVARGRADDVLVLTTSEFGRRVAENSSGTDHGAASVHFLAGGRVNGGQVVGQADLAKLDNGDLPIEIDTRSVYAAALDWLGGPTDEILGAHYDRYGLTT
jgi:uncharacterized protein (DUF1501 family)